jgi:probable rRNA maturation factor
MEVHVINEQSDLKISDKGVKLLTQHVIANEKANTDEVTIHLVSFEIITHLHGAYCNDPTPTDCMSFPLDSSNTPGYNILGDIFVCPHVAIEYSKSHNLNPYHEVTLYITHGLLHLLGYDDLDDISETKMREAEQRHLKLLENVEFSLENFL